MVGEGAGSEPVWRGRFIQLVPAGKAAKTRRFEVTTSGGDRIGMVAWYAPWRKYTFQPDARTVYEWVCLRELASVSEMLTKAHWILKELGYQAKTGTTRAAGTGSEIVYIGAREMMIFPPTRAGREAAREILALISGGA